MPYDDCMKSGSKVLIVGQGDAAEVALISAFKAEGCAVISSHEAGIALEDQAQARAFFQGEKPDYVVLNSVLSGGIGANRKSPADFIYRNLITQTHVIEAARQNGVKKLLYLAASCVYPKECPQPIKEEYFLSGRMEPTSEPYSAAKAAGVVMCQAYRQQHEFPAIVAVPATVYGPGPSHEDDDAHVMAALMAKFKKAVSDKAPFVELWGTGNPRREFIYSEDLASACVYLMKKFDSSDLINIGTGRDIAIRDLARLVSSACGYAGEIRWDVSRPDGAMQKLLDSSRLNGLGWQAGVTLEDGIRKTVR